MTYDDAGDVLIVVRDPGPGFEVAGVPNLSRAQTCSKEADAGFFDINQLMDEVRFAEGGRELRMRKRHTAAAGLL